MTAISLSLKSVFKIAVIIKKEKKMSEKEIKETSSIEGHKRIVKAGDIQAEFGDGTTRSLTAYALAVTMTRFAWELDKEAE